AAVQIIDCEVHQGGTGTRWVGGDLQPPVVGDLPFDESTVHGQIVGRATEEALVPCVASFKIGHGDNGKNMLDGHGSILSSMAKGSANSLTEVGLWINRSTMLRRLGSTNAWNS
ncbi:MAG TPA: hypothetical protein VNV87_02325, partial [Acidimicrobiales bacterium]|nr:hypothetical protein [Acidimicrobiales bacterium]